MVRNSVHPCDAGSDRTQLRSARSLINWRCFADGMSERVCGLDSGAISIPPCTAKAVSTITSLSPELMRTVLAELDQALFNHGQWCEALYSTLICRLPP